MNDLEFYLNWYEKENERRIALENSLNIPIGILSITFGLDFYLLSQYNFHCSSCITTFFLVLFILTSFITSCISSYYLFKSYNKIMRGYEYKAFPFATQLLNYKIELIEYYNKYSAAYPNISGENKFREYLMAKLTEYIDQNAFNNDLKSNAIHSAKRYIFITLLFIILAFMPFVINLL